jgi:hypothetical protein
MKALKILALFLLSLNIPVTSVAKMLSRDEFDDHDPLKGFAVVELYTSEGCSSCPAADALLGRIQKEVGDQPVYILSFHVDYWNRLGWKDQFSSQAFTNRQRQYAKWLNLETVYTPQIVVNGRDEFVGSNEKTLRSTLESDLAKFSAVQLTLRDLEVNQGKVSLKYQIRGNKNNVSVLLAVVQKSAVTKVKNGENSGRTLPHVQIVRNIQSFPVNHQSDGDADVEIPAGLNLKDTEVIAFVQDSRTGEILAAAKSQLVQ